MIGMSATTGRTLDEASHIRQSIRDILRTPIGSRVMRREYGSALFALIDAPMDRATILDIIQATAGAIGRWEPRVRVQRVRVDGVAPGHVRIDIDLLVRATGAQITFADAFAEDPDATLRTIEDEIVRVDSNGRARRIFALPETATDPNDVGAALGLASEDAYAVTLGTSATLAGTPLAAGIYYLAEDDDSATLRIGADVPLTEGESPEGYGSVTLTVEEAP